MTSFLNHRRVVVTGMGVLTSLGDTPAAFYDNLLNGVSGIDSVKAFDTTDYPCKIGADIPEWDPTRVMDIKESRRNDRYTQFALYAALEAFKDSGIDIS